MSEQTIKYKDTEFTLKTDKVSVRKAAAPLMARYTKLCAYRLGDVDTREYNEYLKSFARLELAIEQVKGKNPQDKVIDGEEKTYGEYMNELEGRLDALKKEYENNTKVQIIADLVHKLRGQVTHDLIWETEDMSEFFSKALEGGDISVINPEEPEYEMFSVKVLTDFFLVSAGIPSGLNL